MSIKIIAEIGINHNGDMNMAKKLIDATNACGWNYLHGYEDYVYLLNGSDKTSIKDGNKKLFDNLNELYTKLDIPKLNSYGYNSDISSNIAKDVSAVLQGSFVGNPIPFDDKSAEEILNRVIKTDMYSEL